MRRTLYLTLAVVFAFALVHAAYAEETPGKLNLKAGDTVYVCGCGKGCDCQTMSLKAGKCVCGKRLLKGTVTKVEGDLAYVKTSKGESAFKTTGLYACACGKGCSCDTISQKPGKCACGKPMKKV